MRFIIETPADSEEYKYFYSAGTKVFKFKVRASKEAHLSLSVGPTNNHAVYELCIGGHENTKSSFKGLVETDTPNVLSATELRGFWISCADNKLSVGRDGERDPFMWYKIDKAPIISLVGIRTGSGVVGSWIIGKCDDTPRWVVSATGGKVPPQAVTGGRNGTEVLYVARVIHQFSLLPGTLYASNGIVYVSADGVEYAYKKYEVLTGCTAVWVPTTGKKKLAHALVAGISAVGEELYVGRVNHSGTVTLGKVQFSEGACYIPYHGKELKFEKFEVLVVVSDDVEFDGPRWVAADNGKVPSEAVVGGQDGNVRLHVARAHHEGSLIPGKLYAPNGEIYVSWYGAEYAHKEYEVLCGCDVVWVPTKGKRKPARALVSGKMRDGEDLYVGRAIYRGFLTLGKVQFSQGACFVPYHGKELRFETFEVLEVDDGKCDAPRWVSAAGGKVPPEAVAGGHDGNVVLYVARAYHKRSLLPGKLYAPNGVIYVSRGGAEYDVKEYEVLCGDNVIWVATKGKEKPANALIAGQSECGEDLYVGRVNYSGTVTLGKVQFSHGACYIPYHEDELKFESFEVLVVN